MKARWEPQAITSDVSTPNSGGERTRGLRCFVEIWRGYAGGFFAPPFKCFVGMD
ncbi:MAG: hypothetical protein NTW75_02185 [Planctomycetales bacterium]|nr:hypothetical protein [Planctomycetales bacterium]